MNKTDALAFLDKQAVLMLGTIGDDGAPQMRAVINIRNGGIAPHLVGFFKGDDRILIITNTSSDKIGQIRAEDKASLYAYDQQFHGLLLMGRVREVLDASVKDALWDDSWVMYYPDGKDGGDFSVLVFEPESYKSYANFSVEKGSF
ncbi:MAG: pyridoxamine 5'-phosphate oxidase family protein [Alphaproteobacteria bacterium]|nr:pyridoxamine 5'-phosphate oxidase family protein [Alphaproteobacteria bacterium]